MARARSTTRSPKKPPAPAAPAAPPIAVSDTTLEQTPGRALDLLRAIGTSLPIRAALMMRGYTAEEHARGWRLLQATGGFVGGPEDEVIDAGVRDAIAALDAWDEDGLRIVRASLSRRHPAQAAHLLEGLAATAGAGAVLGVARLLDRLDALERGAGRRETRAADRAALATLASRGIDAAERARLRKLVETAQRIDRVLPPDDAARLEAEARYREALGELRAWFEEWSEIARATIKRRDHLIRLGLATRKVRARAGEGGGDGDEPAADEGGPSPAGG